MNPIERHPDINVRFEALCRTRRDVILSHMAETDSEYNNLCRARADISMTLKSLLDGINEGELFEAYSDAVYAQETYEQDSIYRQALYDAFEVLTA